MDYPLFAEVADFARDGQPAAEGSQLLRCRSFAIVYSRGSGSLPVDSPDEYFLLLPDSGAELEWPGGRIEAPAHSVVIMPAGPSDVRLGVPGVCIRLFAALPASLQDIGRFGGMIAAAPLRPIRSYRRTGNSADPVVYPLDALPNSPGMPRAKLFQTQTMSINWVEYVGPRDRENLSPHAHADFEQASLALAGQFVHHFRTPWGKDANQWREDQHISAGPATIAFIPPEIVHTSEGVGPGRHILIDVFAPPRDDFIAKGQLLNADAYAPIG